MPMLIHLLILSWHISICTRPLLFLVATCFLSKTSLTVGIPIILWFWYHKWYHIGITKPRLSAFIGPQKPKNVIP